VNPERLHENHAPEYLGHYLESKDASVRALAVWTIGSLGAEQNRAQIGNLLTDSTEVTIYLDQNLAGRRVCDLAQQALERCPKEPSK